MVSGTNMVKIIVCIFTILFSYKKSNHYGMNDIVIAY